jgi:hypothetical protein
MWYIKVCTKPTLVWVCTRKTLFFLLSFPANLFTRKREMVCLFFRLLHDHGMLGFSKILQEIVIEHKNATIPTISLSLCAF